MDTNIPSELTRNQPEERVANFIRRAGQSNLFLSVMTIGEIRKGIDVLSGSRKRGDLEKWLAQLAAAAKRKGIVVAVVDGVIAATALENDLTVVTRNQRDFAGLGVSVLNPWETT